MVADSVDSYLTKDFMCFLMCTDNIYIYYRFSPSAPRQEGIERRRRRDYNLFSRNFPLCFNYGGVYPEVQLYKRRFVGPKVYYYICIFFMHSC